MSTNQDADLVAELRARDQEYSFTLGGDRLVRKTLECRAADALERLSAPLEVTDANELERLRGRIAKAQKICDEYDIGDQLDPGGHTHVLRRFVKLALTERKA